MKKLTLSILAILLINACVSTKNSQQTYQTPRFTNEDPILLDVSKVTVVSEFSPSFKRPNVEHLFPISLEKAAQAWANDRLKATDFTSSKEAIVTIKDASVTEEVIKHENLLQKDQLKYVAKLHVVVKVQDKNSFSSAQTEIQGWRELTIPADTSIEEKEKYWNGMLEKLLASFNDQMTKNIDIYLSQYIKK